MGGIAIIGLGNRMGRNAATIKDYTGLYSKLGGHGSTQSATKRFIVINGYGETLAPSAHANWSPELVAAFVKKGEIWIDMTGWPMYYQGSANGNVSRLGQSGWHQFASFLGYSWLSHVVFSPSPNSVYLRSRGFPLAESLDGVCYPKIGAFGSPDGQGVTEGGYTGMIALHPPGGGYYFWGEYYYSIGQVFSHAPVSVTTDAYAQFIQEVLSGSRGNLNCRAYTLSTQHVVQPTPGPSSPIRTTFTHTSTAHHTSHPSSGGTPHTSTSHSTSVKHLTSTPSSNAKSGHLAEDVVLGGTVLTGLGLVTVALLKHHTRTH